MRFLASASWIIQCLVTGLAAAGVTAALTPVVRHFSVHRRLVARPVGDRWKRRVVGKLGGIALFAGVVGGSVIFGANVHGVLMCLMGTALMFAVGLVDDLLQIKPSTKLIAQAVTACLMLLLGIRMALLPQVWYTVPLTLFWLLLITNAVNLLDNMDGVAAGVVAIASVSLALHGYLNGNLLTVILSSAIGGSAIGFLWFNLPPAKIFMGDCGSQMLGMALGITTLLGTWRHGTQLLATMVLPMLLLSVPIFDTLFVAWTRTIQGRKVSVGGTDHVSHRLAILGLSERQVLMVLYGSSALFGLWSLLSLCMSPPFFFVTLLTAFALCLVAGAYLAKVRVYQLEWMEPNAVMPQRPHAILHTILQHKRQVLEVTIDLLLIVVCYMGAYLLRFEARLDTQLEQQIFWSLPIVIMVKLTIFFALGLYRGLWKYVSLVDLVTITKAVFIGSLGSMVALVYLWRFQGYSRAVFVIDGVLLFLSMGAVRVAERLVNDWLNRLRASTKRAIIVGAGDAGELLLRELRNNHAFPYRVVGFVDDDLSKLGRRIHGVPILGPRTSLPAICERQQIEDVLVALPTLSLPELRRFVQPWITQGLRVRVMNALLREASEFPAE